MESLPPENMPWYTPEMPLHSGILMSPLSSPSLDLTLNNSKIEVEEEEQSNSEEYKDQDSINDKTINTSAFRNKAHYTQNTQ
jgi:hypothetical protein